MKVVAFDLEMSGLNADFGIILCGCMLEWRPDSSRRAMLSGLKTFRIDQYKTYSTDKADDRELCVAIRDALETADVLVGWNSARFDIPYLNGRLVYWKERTLPKIKHIDLMYQARYKLKIHSSRLDSVQSFLGLTDSKSKMLPQLWMKAVTGDKKSMDYIVDHCQKDVMVLTEAYDRLKHFIQVIHN